MHKEKDSQGRVDTNRREREEKRITKLRQLAQDLEAPLAEMEDRIGRNGKPKKTNLTDPDSHTMMSGSGGALQGYMAIAVSDPRCQVITAADIAEEPE